MLTSFVRQIHKVKFLLNDNSTTILTGVGVSGTIATAVLTARASFRAANIIEREQKFLSEDNVERLRNEEESKEIDLAQFEKLTTTTKIKLVWKLYIPPVGIGVGTIASILLANKISSKQIAALTVASGISERAFQEYKAKVVEKLGPKQDTAIRDGVAQDRVNNQPIGAREVILAGTGEVLCYDMTTGRYFQSTVEEIRKAENLINREIINFMSASLSHFYDEIGLPPTSYSDSVGWNTGHHLEVQFSTVMSSDGRPCVSIDFLRQPIPDYNKVWD